MFERPKNSALARALTTLLAIALVAMFVSGCGEDASSPSDESSAGGQTAATPPTGESGSEEDPDDASSQNDDSKSSGGGDSANEPSVSGFKADPPPVQLFVDNTTSIQVDKATVESIRTRRQLESLERRQVRGSKREKPDVSVAFNEDRQALAVFLPKSPAGTQMTVSKFLVKGQDAIVEALVLVPSKGCKVSGPSSVRPTAWVETRKLSGKTTLRLERQPLSC